ncbi:hypothetical protein GLOIN_2v1771315 [Rhizophagus irregularis DAOM 181602=DAOM 197198]|nr:hypothetical protein GLOIN_2v1771315 [Rhizophagus irregularis DAOM 181602=DAOM 197198]
MISFFYSNLSKDVSLILNDADDYNVTIKVGENEIPKNFKNDMIIFHKPNIAPNIFDMILRYIYLGELDLTEQPGEDILKLLIASDELLLEELVEYSRDYLIKHQRNWIQKNFVLILNTACKYTSCKTLQDYCFKIICLNPELLITSDNFLSLDKDIFYDLLEREDLLIKEIVIWDHLVLNRPMYRWESFKNKCKGQVDSLVLVKVKQASKIFGGYSSIGFNSIGDSLLRIYNGRQRFYYSSDNFIFSFENEEDTQNMKISRVIKYDKAIYDYYTIGFNFGFNSLYINDCQHLQAYNLYHYYENNINTEMVYNIEEIETFVIVKQ